MLRRFVSLIPLLFGLSQAALAQTYPSKPITLIVPYAAGGGADRVSRLVGGEMARLMNTTIVVENMPGANGRIGAARVAKSAPDGYTLLFTSAGPITISPHAAALAYDPLKDFDPVGMAVVNHMLVVANPGVPVRNMQELVAAARQSPGKLSYASSGVGGTSHLVGELLKSDAKVQIEHIPFRGDAPAMVEVVAGRVPIGITVLASIEAYLQDDRIRVIGSISETRSPRFPNVGTAAEAGFPNVHTYGWMGFLAPAGIPKPQLQQLNTALNKVLESAETKEKLIAMGAVPKPGTSEELRQYIHNEYTTWGRVIKDSAIKLE
ncbi:Bug family tripartite tricarboxylate transporter substrate binding protein [Hydrogenophaga sp. BPS33]|uniref:Bug family tripartite tricarboxylate transporter substrate binding protein n=1 Tax=Hydrogenophaga sp. BPS33 TaxID=2651974 RepID=UPI00135CB52C|nr:tripartite tricarboxylate transporter substrate binding protein [Hydrogenophaga sp. BPS33]